MESGVLKESNLSFRVLGYVRPDGTYAAHCLETDLVGYGDSPETALDNLVELTDMQISFAKYKNKPSLLYKTAPPHIFEIYNNRLQSKLGGFHWGGTIDTDEQITNIPWPMNLPDADFAIAQM